LLLYVLGSLQRSVDRIAQLIDNVLDLARGRLGVCSEIAKGHGGSLDVSSSPDETRFTFKMPLA
jgi:signal transduction histidine kinase